MASPLLLDTHVWLWFANGNADRLVRPIPQTIERAVSAGEAWVSAFSAWELAMLVAKRRLTLATDAQAWIDATRLPPGVRIADVSAEIAVESTRLPDGLTGDPADTIIVATARSLGATLVTCDSRILAHGKASGARVLDARP